MRRILALLLALFVLIAVTEGGVVLCNTPHKGHPSVYSSAVVKRGLRSDDSFNLKSDDDDYFNDESPRKESLRDKILRTMLMEDSEDSNFRAENAENDYSALEASLRADMLRDEARANKAERTRRYMGSNRGLRYGINRHRKYNDDYN